MEDELQAKERNWRSQRDEWRNEIDRLQEEIEKQQKLLSINLSKSPQTQAELYMQYEVARLTSENLVNKIDFFYQRFYRSLLSISIDFIALLSNLDIFFTAIISLIYINTKIYILLYIIYILFDLCVKGSSREIR